MILLMLFKNIIFLYVNKIFEIFPMQNTLHYLFQHDQTCLMEICLCIKLHQEMHIHIANTYRYEYSKV